MTRTTLHHRPSRVTGVGIALTLAVLAVALLPAGAAHAAAYRYWGYYQLSGTTWKFATKGPDQTSPADGAVEGWRFAVGTDSSTRYPRATPTFADLCGTTKAVTGKKRVGVVIDYGRAADTADNSQPPAPVGKCAVVATAATGLEVLSTVAQVRSSKGLICGIDGFPGTGCGDQVKTVSAAAKAPDTTVALKLPAAAKTAADTTKSQDSGSHTGTYVGIGIALLAAAAVAVAALARRRRQGA